MTHRWSQHLVVASMAAATWLVVGCSTDGSSPDDSVARFQFRSAGVEIASGIWAPMGQATDVGIFGYTSNGMPATKGSITLHVSDPSIAEVQVATGTAENGSSSATIRGKRAGVTMLVATASSGASDSTRLQVPAVGGVYDVTTQLTRFSFETPAPSPPDCPGYTLYCTHVRDFTGAALSGSLTVTRDSVYGNFGGLFCSAWTLDGCSAVKPLEATNYAYYSQTKVVTGPGSFEIWLASQGYLSPNVYLKGTASGDSLYGSVSWMQSVGRSPPAHIGTFVAHLRH